MAKTETITLRVNPDLKREAERLCEDMGLTLSTAYTMLLKAIVRTRSIPFRIRAKNDTDMPFYSNQETQAAIEEIEQGIGLSRKFQNTDELMEDLMRDA